MKDLIIGAVTGYGFDQIKPWLNSIKKSGFTGDIALIGYNIDFDTVKELEKNGITIFTFEKDEQNQRFIYKYDFQICLHRFIHYWNFLSELRGKYRYLIATDVKDVIFQKNPSTYLEKVLQHKKLNVSTESLHYKNEQWGVNNLTQSFGKFLYEKMKDNIIVNCGILSGHFDEMLDLFLNIFLLCSGSPMRVPGGGGPDQAALNILMSTKTYKDITHFSDSESGWAAQLGTTGPQVFKQNCNFLIENVPEFIDDTVCTSTGSEFFVIHQYDRTDWKAEIEKRYE